MTTVLATYLLIFNKEKTRSKTTQLSSGLGPAAFHIVFLKVVTIQAVACLFTSYVMSLLAYGWRVENLN